MGTMASKPTQSTRRAGICRQSPEMPIAAVKIHPVKSCNDTIGADERRVRADHEEMKDLAQIFRAMVSDRRSKRKILMVQS
ncbi:hypothetical protein DVH05_001210 [Phytophthora capsici]|nr:hypothetical protein DVH05_001210 [Phytophthora capsici]